MSAREVIEGFWALEREGRFVEAARRYFAADAVMEDPVFGTVEGYDEILAFLEGTSAEFAEYRFEDVRTDADEHLAWVEWVAHQPDGRQVPGIGLYRVEDGKIVRYRDLIIHVVRHQRG